MSKRYASIDELRRVLYRDVDWDYPVATEQALQRALTLTHKLAPTAEPLLALAGGITLTYGVFLVRCGQDGQYWTSSVDTDKWYPTPYEKVCTLIGVPVGVKEYELMAQPITVTGQVLRVGCPPQDVRLVYYEGEDSMRIEPGEGYVLSAAINQAGAEETVLINVRSIRVVARPEEKKKNE